MYDFYGQHKSGANISHRGATKKVRSYSFECYLRQLLTWLPTKT